MASPFEISPRQLARLIGTPSAPVLLDVRIDDDVAADPDLIPGARRLAHTDIESALPALAGQSVVVYCQRGLKLSQGVAALMRARGIDAEVLIGGHFAWRDEGHDRIRLSALPPRDPHGRTRWVTRQRPKIDRIACPWLIRRFIDPDADILFVPASDVASVAERFGAEPFDVDGVRLGHAPGRCSFDAICEAFELNNTALETLASVVRAADLGDLDAVPEAAGLLAVSLGLSRLHRDDNRQLDAGMVVYDALYRWARDARDEVHREGSA